MFLIRRAKTQDIPTLLKLAKMVHFINLPADRDIIADKVLRSRQSFLRAAAVRKAELAGQPLPPPSDAAPILPGATAEPRDLQGGDSALGIAAITARSDLFLFVLEDTESGEAGAGGGVLGTSQIISHLGGPGRPNIFLQLSKRDFFSNTLQQGGSHMVARLVLDETGPTEIGGLILAPSYRGHKLRLGRFLSLVRFHFMGLYRPLFAQRVLAEMMGPITPDGRSTLWEYLGRRFINLTYEEADRFCQYSKEFMISLLPREDIYLTLLPPEARAVIAQVGPETEPARRMLERLGFRYHDRIDPFDGGPNLDVPTDDISLVKRTRRATLGPATTAAECTFYGMISSLDSDGEFRALETEYAEDKSGHVRLTKPIMKSLGIDAGAEIGVTPVDRPAERTGRGNGTAAKADRAPRKRQSAEESETGA